MSALAIAAINCIVATNMTICDNGVSEYSHGSQSEIFDNNGTIAEIYRPANQVEINQIRPLPSISNDLAPLELIPSLDPVR